MGRQPHADLSWNVLKCVANHLLPRKNSNNITKQIFNFYFHHLFTFHWGDELIVVIGVTAKAFVLATPEDCPIAGCFLAVLFHNHIWTVDTGQVGFLLPHLDGARRIVGEKTGANVLLFVTRRL